MICREGRRRSILQEAVVVALECRGRYCLPPNALPPVSWSWTLRWLSALSSVAERPAASTPRYTRPARVAARCPAHATIGSVSPLPRPPCRKCAPRAPCRKCVPRARGALAGRRDEAASGSFATATRVLAAYDALTT